MEHSKLYQYENVAKVSALDYSGKLAVKTTGDNKYDVSSPVNTAENYFVNEDVIVLSNTLDNEEPMKFSFSFKVNKSAIGTGTNLLLDMPGLFSVKSENNTLWFKFYYEDAPAWKYINASKLVDGWNNVALVGDGVKVTLTVNSTVHTVLDSSLTKTITVYSGFSSSNSIVLAQGFPQVNSCDIIVRATSNDVSSHGVLLAKYQSSNQHFCIRGATQKPAFYTGSWTDGVTPIETKKIYWYRVISSAGSTFKYYILPDNKYTIDTLPDILAWTYQCEISTNIFSNSKFAIGYNSSASSEYWKGAISKVHITINDSLFFDSDTAVEGTDFVNNGCTITKDTIGPVYPSLSLGMLKAYQSWLYLKDIEAVKIADASGGEEQKPPIQASDPYNEINFPIDTTTVESYTTALRSGQALFTTVYNSKRLYLWGINIYGTSPEKGQYISIIVFSGKPNSKGSTKFDVGQIEGAEEEGAWVYRYRDNNADQTVEAKLPRVKFLAWKA